MTGLAKWLWAAWLVLTAVWLVILFTTVGIPAGGRGRVALIIAPFIMLAVVQALLLMHRAFTSTGSGGRLVVLRRTVAVVAALALGILLVGLVLLIAT
ncbi:MAG: hypothetical protein LH467_02340 [Gemmatimonadaceae bacterium]|nr:hypothetical protein [Gemmatimonadaceae bacterium]